MGGGFSGGMSLPQYVRKKSMDFASGDEVWTRDNPVQAIRFFRLPSTVKDPPASGLPLQYLRQAA